MSDEQISRITELTKDDLRQIWEDVKKNSAALDACAGPHDFVVDSQRQSIGGREQCQLCGGIIDASNAYWYKKGLRHGRRESERS